MGNGSKTLQVAVWGAMALTIAVIVIASIVRGMRHGAAPGDAPTAAVSGNDAGHLPVLFPVPDFALTNQAGEVVRRSDLLGKVWLSDIIFSRCAGPCPEMTRRMAGLQAAIPASAPVRFISLTTDPNYDSPRVLQSYARRFGAQAGRWHFLTGTPAQIKELAVQGLKLTALEKDAASQSDTNDLFIHSTIFVAVDKRGQVRAALETDEPAFKVKALRIVQQLVEEK